MEHINLMDELKRLRDSVRSFRGSLSDNLDVLILPTLEDPSAENPTTFLMHALNTLNVTVSVIAEEIIRPLLVTNITEVQRAYLNQELQTLHQTIGSIYERVTTLLQMSSMVAQKAVAK